MAVDGVNNSNSNAGLYAGGAALVGAGAGAGVAYLTKPFLKDGAPTDTFIRKIEEETVKTLSDEEKEFIKKSKKLMNDVKNTKNADELKNVLKTSEVFNAQVEKLGISIEDYIAQIDAKNFENAKAGLESRFELENNLSKEMYKEMYKACWDANKNKFVHNAEEIKQDGFNAVKKAARSIQNKYAMIYGAIGVGVLGLGTYLCCAGKNNK